MAAAAATVCWLGLAAQAAELERLELSPHERVLDVALVDLDGDGRIDPVVASARLLGAGRTERFLTFYRVGDDALEPVREQKVPDDVVSFGLGDLRGRGRSELLYFTAQSVFAFDLETQKATRILAEHRFPITQAAPRALPFWDAVLDLNGDGRDDLMLAAPEGYSVYLQTADGKLVAGGNLTAGRSYGSVPLLRRRRQAWASGPLVLRRSVRQMAAADVNGDQRLDLIGMQGDHLLAFAQSGDGSFPSDPTLEHRLVAHRSVPFARYGGAPPPEIQHGDVDADGREDFVVPALDLKELVTRLRVFLASPQGLPDTPSQILKLSSLCTEPELVDMNGDGTLDLGCAAFRSDRIAELAAAPGGRRLDFTYFGFLFRREERSFSRQPDLRFEASWELPEDDADGAGPDGAGPDGDDADRAPEGGETGFIRLAGDFDADGRKDLVLFTGQGELTVHALRVPEDDVMRPSIESSALFQTQLAPARRVSFVDLDADGRSDVVLLRARSVDVLRVR